ncbi:uncharacterized protein BP5553_01644 [Venustampulla echinocandica]|uniref:Uncharacterized protein n=1 Tax=Venustampulla echinocandica TaxID=2656787 RepID=A0A370U1M3_9HELO|nr:uncharacterized protein BP5553_01644 [Venustampulla echinocandica]RDL41665.1 hypothetical protein BP5553_01644 [Venustampulla echinocandica]
MQLVSLFEVSALVGLVFSQFMVPVPWYVSSVTIGNIRHGTGGFWNLNISDTPTLAPQGFNTSCAYYNPTTYIFALDGAPYKAPCANPNVTFGLFPNGGCGFTLNVTHTYGDCSL